jgi:hypothetical protein
MAATVQDQIYIPVDERSFGLPCRLGEAKCLYRLRHPLAGVMKGLKAVDTDFLSLDQLGQDAPRGVNGSLERFVFVYDFLSLGTRLVLEEEESPGGRFLEGSIGQRHPVSVRGRQLTTKRLAQKAVAL